MIAVCCIVRDTAVERTDGEALERRGKVLAMEHPSTLTSVYSCVYSLHRQITYLVFGESNVSVVPLGLHRFPRVASVPQTCQATKKWLSAYLTGGAAGEVLSQPPTLAASPIGLANTSEVLRSSELKMTKQQTRTTSGLPQDLRRAKPQVAFCLHKS